MFLHVVHIHAVGPFALRLELNDGSLREVDLSEELYGEVFEPLRDPELFRTVQLNPETGTVEWPNGADFAPELLHRIGRKVERVA